MGCRRTACSFFFNAGPFFLGFKELLLHAWSTSFPPSLLTFVPEGLLLSHFLLLSLSCSCTVVFHFLNLVSQTHNHCHSWLSSDSSGSLLEVATADFYLICVSFSAFVHRDHPCGPPATTENL